MKNKILLMFGILFLFSLTFISAEIQVGTSGNVGVDLNIPTPVNYTLVNINNSIYWDGNPWSDDRWVFTTGDTMTGDLDMSGNDLILGDDSYLNIEGTNPVWRFDTGNDFLAYDTISDYLELVIGGATAFKAWADVFSLYTNLNMNNHNITNVNYINGVNLTGDFVPYIGATKNVDLNDKNITYGTMTNSTLNQIYTENTEEEFIIWI